MTPRGKATSLKPIGKEILKVQRALEALRKKAPPASAKREKLDLKIHQLRALRQMTVSLCNRIWV